MTVEGGEGRRQLGNGDPVQIWVSAKPPRVSVTTGSQATSSFLNRAGQGQTQTRTQPNPAQLWTRFGSVQRGRLRRRSSASTGAALKLSCAMSWTAYCCVATRRTIKTSERRREGGGGGSLVHVQTWYV